MEWNAVRPLNLLGVRLQGRTETNIKILLVYKSDTFDNVGFEYLLSDLVLIHTDIGYDNASNKFVFQGGRVKVTGAIFMSHQM